MNCFIGIDGGGTATRAALTDAAGICRAVASCAPANILHLSRQEFKRVFHTLFNRLYAQSGKNSADIARVAAGLAGTGRNADRLKAESVFAELGFAGKATIVSDMDIALAGAIPAGPGIVLNAGTGSIVLARDAAGRVERCGGWGYLLGDEGSGYAIGLEALRCALKSRDTVLPETELTQLICTTFGIGEVAQLVPKVYAESLSRRDIAALAPGVLDAAERGDRVALMITGRAGEALGGMVAALIRRLSFPERPVSLCLAGGVFRKRTVLLPALMREIRSDITLVDPEFHPVAGALLIAMQEENVCIDDAVRRNLKKISVEQP